MAVAPSGCSFCLLLLLLFLLLQSTKSTICLELFLSSVWLLAVPLPLWLLVLLAFLKRIKAKGDTDNRPRLRKCSLNVSGVEDVLVAVVAVDSLDEPDDDDDDDDMEVLVDEFEDDEEDFLFFFSLIIFFFVVACS